MPRLTKFAGFPGHRKFHGLFRAIQKTIGGEPDVRT